MSTVAEWRARAEAAAVAGDARGESDARRELATRLMAAGDADGARGALERTLALARQLGEHGEESRTLYALALLQARTAPRGGAARHLLEEAESAARRSGDLRFLARVLDKRANFLVAEGKYAPALRLLADVAALHASCGDEDARFETLRRVAMLTQMLGRSGEAFDVLIDAMKDVPASPAQMVRARLELHLLARGAGVEGAEPLSNVLAAAEAQGDPAAAGYVRLQMAADALMAGDVAGGETLADAARGDALEATDPILYLNACLMIAEAREKQGDRVGMLTILFTCRSSLEDLLGPKAGQPVLALVHTLEEKWGADAFAAALQAYRAQFS